MAIIENLSSREEQYISKWFWEPVVENSKKGRVSGRQILAGIPYLNANRSYAVGYGGRNGNALVEEYYEEQ